MISPPTHLVLLAQVPEEHIPGRGIRHFVVPHSPPREADEVGLKTSGFQALHKPSNAGSILHRHLVAKRGGETDSGGRWGGWGSVAI